MQMNRRFYLISRDTKFSNQFAVHFSINSISSIPIAEFSNVQIKKYGLEKVNRFSNRNMNSAVTSVKTVFSQWTLLHRLLC